MKGIKLFNTIDKIVKISRETGDDAEGRAEEVDLLGSSASLRRILINGSIRKAMFESNRKLSLDIGCRSLKIHSAGLIVVENQKQSRVGIVTRQQTEPSLCKVHERGKPFFNPIVVLQKAPSFRFVSIQSILLHFKLIMRRVEVAIIGELDEQLVPLISTIAKLLHIHGRPIPELVISVVENSILSVGGRRGKNVLLICREESVPNHIEFLVVEMGRKFALQCNQVHEYVGSRFLDRLQVAQIKRSIELTFTLVQRPTFERKAGTE